MSELQSSSEYRDRGLLSPNMRRIEIRRILLELRVPDQPAEISRDETEAAQDLCFRLYSEEVSNMMAERLGSTQQAIRETLDAALKMSFPKYVERAAPLS